MAHVIGGLGVSHSPSMGYEFDRAQSEGFDPCWQHWYNGTRRVKTLLAALRPSHMVIVYNDHLNHFDFDAYPTLAIGVDKRFRQADEGWGPRPFPDLRGDPAWGIHLTESLIADEFDMTVCQDLGVDHGIFSWLPYVCDAPWPMSITPIAVNMIRHPLPTSRRMIQLGAALRRAIEARDCDERVMVVATGGMSHQISGMRFGMANEALDHYFLQTLPTGLERLAAIPQTDYMRYGGTEAVELVLWFAMRAALSDAARAVYDFYTFPKITGCGALVMIEPSVCSEPQLKEILA